MPAQNLIYADVDGNIGYQTPGQLPIRGAGDGSMPQPGWDSAYDWQGFIPFEELPVSYNPAEGYIVTANNAIVGDDYPYLLTRDWDYGWRAARIVDLLQRKAAEGPLTADDMRDIQADNGFCDGHAAVAPRTWTSSTGRQGPDAALDLLRSWDAQNDADSDAAAYANVLWDELVHDLFVTRPRGAGAGRSGRAACSSSSTTLLADPRLGVVDQRASSASRARRRCSSTRRSAAYDRLVELQGDNPAKWNWGSLHALPAASATRSARRASRRSRRSSTAVRSRSAAARRSPTRPAGTSA